MPVVAPDKQFFHESWYRISGERISLRASVRVRRQFFRGARWYILHEPFSDQFFRLRPAAYRFVSRLDSGETVGEVWQKTIADEADDAPGQEEVIQLLAQLYHANLLHFNLPADSERLFERFKERRQSIRHASLRNIMFFRIPLFDPNGLLRRLLPLIRIVVSPFGALVWLVVMIAASATVVGHFGDLRVQAQGLLSLSNLPLLYVALIVIKTLHEFGHAITVRRFGGSVHTMGIMFLIFNPLPYTDSTAAWSFRSKWQRVLVGAAGMIAELFVAAIAVFVWANTGIGTLHALAYNMMIVASVSTLVFNVNPLMRFDGYYILSDLLDIPNLHSRSSQQLRHLVERYGFGYKQSKSSADSSSEAAWLTVFGVASGLYKLVVFSTILIIIADRFLLLGIIMAAVCAVAWVVTPLLRLVHYLATSPRLERTRLRAISVCTILLAALVATLGIIPFSNGFRAPGVLQAAQDEIVTNNVAGFVDEVLVKSDTPVKKGTALLRLSNRDLSFRMDEVQAHLREARYLQDRALNASPADLKTIESTIASIDQQLARLRTQESDLVVTAESAGTWVAPDVNQLNGTWIQRGRKLGHVIDETSFYFYSVISQENASSIFSNDISEAQVRLADDPAQTVRVTAMTRIPMQQNRLPSRALGLQGGGNVATAGTSGNGTTASQTFYELRLKVSQRNQAPLYQGLSGEVRFGLPPLPLLQRAYLKLRQLIQARYQI